MKPKVLLVLSLALNLLLVLYIVRPAPAGHPSEAEKPSSSEIESKSTAAPSGLSEEMPATNAPARTFNWQWVESPDYRQYIANLRAIGCPEETIRDIIVADVNKLYAEKKREIRGEPKKFEYWKAGNPWMSQLDADYTAKARALEDEKLNVLRQLGIEPDAKMQMNSFINAADALDNMFGFLPDDKQVSVMKIMQDMQSELAKAAEDGGGFDPEAMQAAQKKTEEAIKAILTPDEFRDYELRMSMTANSMRSQLAGWEPDEQEFLKVYELRKTFDDDYSMLSRANETDAERAQREQVQAQMNDAIKQVLGEEEYANYQRAQDWNFQQIYQAAKRADLGTAEAAKVYEMRQAAQEEVRSINQNQDLTLEQRTAALQGIQAETERSIKQVLGDEGWDQYNRGYNTTWLKNMVPRAPSTTTQD